MGKGSIKPLVISTARGDLALDDLDAPLPLDRLAEGTGPWEVEIGFGKGRYLLERAEAEPDGRFLGVEIASKYHRILMHRARRRGLTNLAAVRGEALYLLSAALPLAFARAVHVYFPDPWPKSRHHKRRLFDTETVDLVLGLLAPGGRLWFATDFLDYGELVREILESYPGLVVDPRTEPWPGGPRTHYEAKYVEEGRPILRLGALFEGGSPPARLHPRGETGVTAAWAPPEPDEEEEEEASSP